MAYTRCTILAIIAVPLLLTGCASKKPRTRMEVTGGPPVETIGYAPTATVDKQEYTPDYTTGQPTAPLYTDNTSNTGTEEGMVNGRPAITRILFDFDSSIILPDALNILHIHSTYLLAHPEVQVTLEGHGDERGTREYNLALGERRSQAVNQFLVTQGVGANQLRVFSYGEERPIDPGQDEAAWSQNRRVEIVY